MPLWFLANIAVYAAVLAAIGLVFLGLLVLILRLVWRGSGGKRFWLAAAWSVGIAVVAFTFFLAISAPFRYERPVERLVSSPAVHVPYRDFASYWVAARLGFFATWALALSSSGLIGYRLASGLPSIHRLAYATATLLTSGLYVLAALPLMEFAHACLIGQEFLLESSC